MSAKNSSQLSLASAESVTGSTYDNSDTCLMAEDWQNRQFVQSVTTGIQKIVDFLNAFDKTCKIKLAKLNSKMTSLEESINFLENRFSKENLMNQSVESKE